MVFCFAWCSGLWAFDSECLFSSSHTLLALLIEGSARLDLPRLETGWFSKMAEEETIGNAAMLASVAS